RGNRRGDGAPAEHGEIPSVSGAEETAGVVVRVPGRRCGSVRCEEALEWIQRELDGDLAPEEEVLLRRHLSTCIQCAAEADRFRRLSEGLSRLPRVTPPHS